VADVEMTQAELDALIQGRLERQATTIRGEYADYDELKAAKTKLEELQQSQETETERRIREAKEQADARVPDLVSAAVSNARTALISAELRSFAIQHGFKYPDDVIDKLASHTGISVTDDFKVKGAEKLVKDLATERPEWLAGSTFNGAPPRNGSGNGTGQISAEEQATINARAAAYRRQAIGSTI
jgi:hypothetical protein